MSARRVIKFRAWDGAIMYSADALYDGGDGLFSAHFHAHDDVAIFRDEILMQFTGLHDKNGKEIYEGDIVDVRTNAPVAVEWDDDMAGWKPWSQYNETVPSPGERPQDIEVIGNIYQHPELMEAKS